MQNLKPIPLSVGKVILKTNNNQKNKNCFGPVSPVTPVVPVSTV